jgi:AcrR family transcriptional regulator
MAARSPRIRPTLLALHVAGDAPPRPVTPLDVLHAARGRFLAGQRLDMAELATDLGIARATLYRWVGAREHVLGEILWSLAERGLVEARAHADAVARDAGPDWVLQFYTRFMELTASFEPIRRFVDAERDAALRVLTSKHGVQQRRLIDALRTILEQKSADGQLTLRLGADELAFVMVRIAESFIWRELITGDEPDLAQAANVVRVLLS